MSIGDGLTGADMPNNGEGTYSGNWVAAVRAADEDGNGPIVLESGAASIVANFGMGRYYGDPDRPCHPYGRHNWQHVLGDQSSR